MPTNTITTPGGDTITLPSGPPRSLDGAYGLLVVSTREYRDRFISFLRESCATVDEQQDEGRSEEFESPLGQILPFQSFEG